MKSANLLFIVLKALQRKGNKNFEFRKPIKKIEISLDDANNLGKYNSIKNELGAVTLQKI